MDTFFEINIPAGLNTVESHFFIIDDVKTFTETLLTNNGLSPDDIGVITGVTATLETRFSGLDLDFIQDIGVHLLPKDDPSDRREAFYIFNDFVNFGTKTEIPMIPSILDLKDQMLDETVNVEFKINLRNFLPQELDARVTMKFFAYPPE